MWLSKRSRDALRETPTASFDERDTSVKILRAFEKNELVYKHPWLGEFKARGPLGILVLALIIAAMLLGFGE